MPSRPAIQGAPDDARPALVALGRLHGLLAKAWPLGILCFVVLFVAGLDGDLKVHHDAAIYVSLATALVNGHGYADIFLADAAPHTKYPPLFPALLVPIVAVLGYHVPAMKLLVFGAALLSFGALYALCRRADSAVVASLVVLLTATSHGFVFYTQSVMSEMPYVLFSLLALLGILTLSTSTRWPVPTVTLVIACVIAAYLTRLLGLSLLIAGMAWTLIDAPAPLRARLKRVAVLAGIGAAPAVAWFVRNQRLGEPAGTSYDWGLSGVLSTKSLGALVAVLVDHASANVAKYVRHAARVVFFPAPAVSDVVLPLALALLVAGGFLGCVLFRRTVLEYYVALYASVILLFPGSRPQRYLVPLIPFVWYYGLLALRAVHRWLAPRVPRGALAWATAAALALLIVSNAAAAVRWDWIERGRDGYYHVTGEDGYQTAALWARAHTPADSVFLWAKPALRFLVSDRRGVRPALLRTRPSGGEHSRLTFDYVVVDRFAERDDAYLQYAVRQHGIVCPVYRDDVSEIYAVGRRCSS